MYSWAWALGVVMDIATACVGVILHYRAANEVHGTVLID